MNFTIDRDILIENLNIITRGLPSKSPMPILTGIRMEVTETDLFMTSSNTDISVEVMINDSALQIESTGKTVVPGKFFIDIIRKINSRKVNLYLMEEKTLVIKADRGEYKLHIMNPIDYPNIDFVCLENPLVLNSRVLKSLIRETCFATSSSEKKPLLTGVNIRLEGNKLTAVATDSYRLSQKTVDIDTTYENLNITIPNKALDELSKAMDNFDDDVELYFASNKLLFKYKNILFQTRLLEGNYPDTSRLIPAEFPIIIKFNKDELLSTVERVSLLSPRDKEKDKEITFSIIKLEVKKNKTIEISSTNSQIGDAFEEIIPTDNSISAPIKIGFSSRYLVEALRSFQSTEISLNFSGEVRPFIIKGERDNNLTQLILPVRMD